MLLRKLVLLYVCLAAGTAAVAQDAIRIGYVDIKAALDKAPQVVAGRERVTQEFLPRNDAIFADEKRLVDMEQRLSQESDLSDSDRTQLERDIRSLQRAVNRRKEDLREEINFRLNEIINDLEETVDYIIQDIAREENYDLILASGAAVLYHSPAIDITPKVVERLRQEYTADQQELATEVSR